MKKLFNLIIKITFLIMIFGFTDDSSGCKLLHKGTFKYGNTEKEIKVVIKGNKHTEYHNGGKYIIESKLDWVNDCEYNMTMTKITIPDFPYKVGDVMNVKINEVKENDIYYTSTVNGKSWKGKLIKIE